MAMKYDTRVPNFLQLAENRGKRFTTREIAEYLFKAYPDDIKEKKSNAENNRLENDDACIQQIGAEISAGSQKILDRNPTIKTTADRPKKWYVDDNTLLGNSPDDNADSLADDDTNISHEKDLYPLLMDYLYLEFNKIRSIIINANRAPNAKNPKGTNMWLYPDIVAIEVIDNKWCDLVKNYTKSNNVNWFNLWSFEVKVEINMNNLRKVFFQSVSNSSWANYGYLVTSSIADDNTLSELKILAAAHGIGIITLNKDYVSESSIIIPARYKENIDIDSMNKLAKESTHFQEFLTTINNAEKSHLIQPINEINWNKIKKGGN